ncbi:MAG: DNA-directed RNA polymerase subunit beta [Deltaproteobacteria bacterium]|nr:DNA-directed RNA polymerase subunit beta [Deltaproteobacteria bacterium]
MPTAIQQNFSLRKNFAKIRSLVPIPNLIDIQRKSYEKFLQLTTDPDRRENLGLQAVFNSVFPIRDYNEVASLEFVSYTLQKPKYDTDECRSRGMTYAAPMVVTIRLVVWDKDEVSGTQSIRDVKETEVFFGEIPLMTEHGTFIVNGTERVVVSQLHRSPGAFFDSDKGRTHASGKLLYNARIIPYRGSWLDFEFDHKDILYCRIDRRRKFPATVLLKALGYTAEELLAYYYKSETLLLEGKGKFAKTINYELLEGQRATRDIKDPETKEILVKKNRKFTPGAVKRMKAAQMEALSLADDEVNGLISAEDIVNMDTGEVFAEANEAFTVEKLEDLRKAGYESVKVLFIDGLNVGSFLRDTLVIDKVNSREESILEIYRRLRPGDPPTVETAENLFQNLFFNAERYDLSEVGRLKLNHKFSLEEPLTNRILTKRDILEVVKYLIELRNGRGSVDDIDHLGNRRVRAVGELLENQFRVGLVRMERAIKERMSVQEIEAQTPQELVNHKPVAAVVKEFFGSSQLSQFMDQTNPLSEVTHKRRLSALGPGGLTRERAGFEVRDVHPTHYGRICPVETPEGPNIGLISSLSTFAQVNEYGFVETPYRKVKDGRVTEEVEYFTALQEEQHVIAQANAPIDDKGNFTETFVQCRHSGDTVMQKPEDITLMDVSPSQLVSVAAGLIPFLENDDANRALMGANMQRQAVPLLRSDAPLVGTGMEFHIARDSGVCTIAKRAGVVDYVDATRVVVRVETTAVDDAGSQVDIYKLNKWMRSNQSTCFTQTPIVTNGDRVQPGDVIADGPSTECGDLALGRNVTVAFMPWQGYNFEDSILISERILKEDLFTSVHIEEYEAVARDTKLGPEEITRDIPNAGEEALKDLDEAGIIRVGADVKAGDILVGKITPKGETQLSPEEKLLRAIFGEKAGDVRDTSLRMPPGTYGTVIDAKVFTRKGIDKDVRAQAIEDEDEAKLLKDQNDEVRIIRNSALERVRTLLTGQVTTNKLVDDKGKVLLKKSDTLDHAMLDAIDWKYYGDIPISDDVLLDRVRRVLKTMADQTELVRTAFSEKIERLKKGDDGLAPGVIKMVKVYIAVKRKLQPGDKMAGRHGNKGVVSRVLPQEDMPYLQDGTPVDIVLNPLGVPSRMNVGQILETHLGWAAKGIGERVNRMLDQNEGSVVIKAILDKALHEGKHKTLVKSLSDDDLSRLVKKLKKGVHMATPVFDGAKEPEIRDLLELGGRDRSGQSVLFDGRTGEAFDSEVTVGTMYMLKLHHLVDDKIHARSIGPYSLVTQQPLGGKAQFGGQRLGEMEVWAMEAYGAAYALQEFLTVKSDDVVGRTRMYEAIVKGEHVLESGIPESFNVLIKELQSLALDVQLLEDQDPLYY